MEYRLEKLLTRFKPTYLVLPPENMRKSLVFWSFQGGIEREHWPENKLSWSRTMVWNGSDILQLFTKIRETSLISNGVNPSRSVNFRKLYWNKNKLNSYFHTSLWCLKKFCEGLHQTFWGITKKYEDKI